MIDFDADPARGRQSLRAAVLAEVTEQMVGTA